MDVTESIVDTINASLETINQANAAEKVKILLQCSSFFIEIIEIVSKEGVFKRDFIIESINRYLEFLIINLCAFSDFKEDFERTCRFLILILNIQKNLVFSDKLSRFIIESVSLSAYSSTFEEAIHLATEFLAESENKKLLLSQKLLLFTWESLFQNHSESFTFSLFDMIIISIDASTIESLSGQIDTILNKYPTESVNLTSSQLCRIMTLFYKIFRYKPDPYLHDFLNNGCIKSNIEYIINNDSNEVLLISIPSKDMEYGRDDIIVEVLCGLLSDKRTSYNLRLSAFHQLSINSTSKYIRDSLVTNHLSNIIDKVNEKDYELVTLLFELISDLYRKNELPAKMIIPFSLKYLNYGTCINADLHPLFSIIYEYGSYFDPFIPKFLDGMFFSLDNHQVYELNNKYSQICGIVEPFLCKLNVDAYVSTLLQLSNCISIRSVYIAFQRFIANNIFYERIELILDYFVQNPKDADLFLTLCTSVTEINSEFGSYVRSTKVPILSFQIAKSASVALQFVSSLTCGLYTEIFDELIYGCVKVLPSIPDDIDKYVFNKGALVLPSLLLFTDKVCITNPRDLYIASKKIKLWLKVTNRPINQFPCIDKIAMQYVDTDIARMIIQNSCLLSETIKNYELKPPMFVFRAEEEYLQLELPDSIICLTFWLHLSSCQGDQNIVTFCGVTVSQQENTISVNGERLTTISHPHWAMIGFSYDQELKECSVCVNNHFSKKISCQFSPIALFGSRGFQSSFIIGGTIRFFNIVPDFNRISNNGVCFMDPIGETFSISPNSLDIEIPSIIKGYIPIAPSKTIVDFIYGYNCGSDELFELAIQPHHDFEIARNYIISIIYLEGFKPTCKDKSLFTTKMNILFHVHNKRYDWDMIQMILQTLSSNEDFEWSAFLRYVCDFNLLLSDISSLSPFFYALAAFDFKNEMEKHILINLMMYFIILPESTHEMKLNSFDVLKKVNIRSNSVALFMVSYPYFGEALKLIPGVLNYNFEEDVVIDEFVNYYTKHIPREFKDYYLLSLLPKKNCFEIVKWIMKHNVKYNKKNLIGKFFNILSYEETWNFVLKLITNKDITMDDEFDLSSLDSSILSDFLNLYICLIISSIHLPSDHKFVRFSVKLTKKISESSIFKDSFLSGAGFFLLTSLMGLGIYEKKNYSYPPYPNLSDSHAIAEVSLSPGQFFPLTELNIKKFEKVQYIPETSDFESVLKIVNDVFPKAFYVSSSFTLSLKTYNIDLRAIVRQNLENCRMNFANDEYEFIDKLSDIFAQKNEYNVANIQSHPLYIALLEFFTKFIQLYPKKINDILFLPTTFDHEYSVFMLQNVCISLLENSISSQLHLEVVNFVCLRFMDGWFNNMHIAIINLLLNAIQMHPEIHKKLPPIFYSMINSSFFIIPLTCIESLAELYLTYKDIVFSGMFYNDSFNVCAFIYFCLEHETTLPEYFSQLLNDVVNKASKSEQFMLSWKRYSEFDFESSVRCVFKHIKDQTFLDEIQRINKIFIGEVKSLIKSNVESQIILIKNKSANYSKMLKDVMIQNSKSYSFSKAVGKTIQDIIAEALVIQYSVNLRQKEKFIYENIKTEYKAKTRNSLSILLDPIFPMKRVIDSPLLYDVPRFPNGSGGKLYQSSEILDKSVTNCTPHFIKDRCHENELFNYNMKPYLNTCSPLLFSMIVNTTPHQLKNICQITFSLTKTPFYNCSMLYGVTPLKGCMAITSDIIYFFVGLRSLKDGLCFQEETDLETFKYYFNLIASGYFGRYTVFQGHFVLQIDISSISSIKQHYWLHLDTAYNVSFYLGYHFVLIFEDTNGKNSFYNKVLNSPLAFLDKCPPVNISIKSPVTSAYFSTLKHVDLLGLWSEGKIGNEILLCCLNYHSRRSYADFTQYFVYPWVLDNYKALIDGKFSYRDLSLPMGQIGKERAMSYEDMFNNTEGHYFYGSHYMHIGVLTYFLIRLDPFCFIACDLFKGWDRPNRMFASIQKTWECAAHFGPTDVKELPPQLYNIPECLICENLELDDQQDFTKDVKIPEWATTPAHFINQMSIHLNSKLVSDNISDWIDLIFGYKSFGSSAIDAKNVFHPLCYPKQKFDTTDKKASETMIINFGQCCEPILGSKPCPKAKAYCHWQTLVDADVAMKTEHKQSDIKPFYLYCYTSIHIPGGAILLKDGALYIQNKELILISYNPTARTLSVSNDQLIAAVGHLEGYVILYRIIYKRKEVSTLTRLLQFETSKGEQIISISPIDFIVACCVNNMLYIFDIGLNKIVQKRTLDHDIFNVKIDHELSRIILCGTNSIISCNMKGIKMDSRHIEEKITSLDICSALSYFENKYFVTGHTDGCVRLWYICPKLNKIMLSKTLPVDFGSEIIYVELNDKGTRLQAETKNGMKIISINVL